MKVARQARAELGLLVMSFGPCGTRACASGVSDVVMIDPDGKKQTIENERSQSGHKEEKCLGAKRNEARSIEWQHRYEPASPL